MSLFSFFRRVIYTHNSLFYLRFLKPLYPKKDINIFEIVVRWHHNDAVEE